MRNIVLLLLVSSVVALVGMPGALAFPGETQSCDTGTGGCHTLSSSISVTTNVTSITVSPGQSFAVGINWSGGQNSSTSTAGTTEVNWPTTFSVITRDNTLFNPTLRIPAPSPAGASGTTSSVLTAPAAVGNYIVRVYTSSGPTATGDPDGTNFQDINVTVAAPTVSVLKTITVSPSTATLNVNGTQAFTATAMDQNNTPMAGINISWTVDNSTVGNVSTLNMVTDMNGNANTTFMALAVGNAMVNATNGTVSGNATVTVAAPTAAPIPKLTLILNATMDDNPPIVNNITSAVLLDTSGNTVATAALPDNMTAQFNLSGIIPGDYFIEVNGLAGDHLPTRIDSNASDINQSAGLMLQHSVIGNISNPTYRIEAFPSGLDSHPVVNYATGLNETIYNFVIVPGNISRIEVRVLNTSAELSNFTPTSDTHPAGANFPSEPFQIWILGDTTNSTGAFIGNHGMLFNSTADTCSVCHGNVSIKRTNYSDIKPPFNDAGGWCFRCHNGPGGPDNGFVDPRVVVAANGTIAGNVTNESNGSAISGATVTANGMMATTDANGSYSISIAAGAYNVTASMTGFQTNTTTGVVVVSGNVTTQDFALSAAVVTPQTFNISGFKINDINGNGVWDSGEMGIENWNINLLNATTGTQMANTSTDASGFYQFMNLTAGSYNVTEQMKAGFNSTNATSRMITVENMDATNVNFTNQPVAPSAIVTSFVLTPDLTTTLKGMPISITIAALNGTMPQALFNGMANITITANNVSAVSSPMNVSFTDGNATIQVTSSVAQFVTVTATSVTAANNSANGSTQVMFADKVFSLSKGWNLISIPNFAEPSSVSQLLKNVQNNGVVGFDSSTGNFTTPTDLEPLFGYWINVTADNQSIGFIASTTIPSMPPTRKLFEGWNLIGVSASRSDPDTLSAGGLFVDLKRGLDFTQWLYTRLVSFEQPAAPVTLVAGTDLSDTTSLKQGHGYWLFIKDLSSTNANNVPWAGKQW